MPRKPRYYLAGAPCHVVTRGNDRTACFFAEQDYEFYLECLSSACDRYHVALHAYVLMTNHIHLLMTPEDKEGISRVMQSIGRRYVQSINTRYKRTGTLFEGRHKASLVDTENYLLVCYKYIELNPVRAKMVEHPSFYKWSSYQQNAELGVSGIVTPHDVYKRLGTTDLSRVNAYKDLFHNELSDKAMSEIRKATTFSMPLGNRAFQDQIEKTLGRGLGYSKRGRPLTNEVKCE